MTTFAGKHPCLAPLANDASLAVGADGWAMLAPWGDFPGEILNQAGSFPAIQRVDRAAGEEMARNLRSFGGRAARFFRQVPIYRGHPDAPGFAEKYPDATPKGAIADLEVREDGLYIRPAFAEDGAALINGAEKLGLSAYWDAAYTGEQDAEGRPIFRPYRLRSAGLTPTPNLPVPMLNDAAARAAGAGPGAPQDNPNPHTMDRTKLIAALAAAGVASLANDASDDAILASIRDLGTRASAGTSLANEKTAAETALAAARTDLTTARTELDTLKGQLRDRDTAIANERKARCDGLIDMALQTGRITAADKPTWERRLNADFANESAALAALEPKVKVEGTASANERKGGKQDSGELKGRDRLADAIDRDPAVAAANAKKN